MKCSNLAVFIAAQAVALCVVAEASAQLGPFDIDPQQSHEECGGYPRTPDPDEDTNPQGSGDSGEQESKGGPTSVNQEIEACLGFASEKLAQLDDNTEWLSGASLVGALGAVASGLTGQAAGTMNAWLGLSLGPVVADDIQQRPQLQQIFANVHLNLTQMRCRANFLVSQHQALDAQQGQLKEEVARLENVLRGLPESVLTASTGARAKLGAIAREGFRVLGEARRLVRRIELMPTPEEIELIQQASYNNIVNEMNAELRARNISPLTAFRGVLAAPFRSTANFLAGGGGDVPNYATQIPPSTVNLTAAFRLRADASWTTPSPSWIGVGNVPSYLELVGDQRDQARDLSAATDRLLALGLEVENDLNTFVVLGREGAELCPNAGSPPAQG